MNIVIPMAGEGRRFSDAGYTDPKPLIDICGQPMIRRVIESLRVSTDDNVLLLSQIDVPLPDVTVVRLPGPTEGAADTLRYAPLDDGPVLVANCDQLVMASMRTFVNSCRGYQAGLVTFNSTNPHHSYVKRELSQKFVCEIAEKRVISDEACAGVYWFQSGELMLDYASAAVETADRVNGECYVSSIFDLMLEDRLPVLPWEVGVQSKHMLGTPEELRIFLDKVADGRVRL